MTDPASLTVALTLTGLDITEAQQVLTSLAAGRSMTITATQPVLGGRRFAVTAEGLSLVNAEAIVVDLRHELEARQEAFNREGAQP